MKYAIQTISFVTYFVFLVVVFIVCFVFNRLSTVVKSIFYNTLNSTHFLHYRLGRPYHQEAW